MDLDQEKIHSSEWSTMCTQGIATTSSAYKKMPHPRSPHANGIKCTTSFHLSSTVRTPPAKRFQRIRVRNPFESALAERMHLPLIGSSPSLFQRPVTPQHSSTQFEWTIDEVSSLKPTNVEPHETQFHDSPDPDYEDKVQSAISSYFKEQQIVPSPVDCPLRNGRIIMSEMNGNTPISKPGRRIRDCGTQTELSLPAVLPAVLEEALRPYLQPQLTVSDDIYIEGISRQDGSMIRDTTDTKDISLRRKLFDMQNIIVLDNCDDTPQANMAAKQQQQQHINSSPLSMMQFQHTAIIGKLSDSLDKSSFGSLSPISATDELSISSHSPRYKDSGSSGGDATSASKRKQYSRLPKFLNDLDEVRHLSPIHPPARNVFVKRKQNIQLVDKENYRCELNNTTDNTFAELNASSSGPTTSSATSGSDCNKLGNRFTPERSSSPMLNCMERAELSTDSSFSMRVSRLVVNSSKCITTSDSRIRMRTAKTTNIEADSFVHDDTVDTLDMDEDDMQVSQLSTQSSSSNETPRSKRRSASRKNLSQSFTNNWLETEEDEAANIKDCNAVHLIEEQHNLNVPELHEFLIRQQQPQVTTQFAPSVPNDTKLTFYRVDSGFNEMTTSSSSCSALQTEDNYNHTGVQHTTIIQESIQHDISSAHCSTPSKSNPTINGGY